MKRHLIIIANQNLTDPMGDGIFIAKELKTLEKSFDKVSVVVAFDKNYNNALLKCIKLFFCIPLFVFTELKNTIKFKRVLGKKYKYSFWRMVKDALSYQIIAKNLEKRILRLIKKDEKTMVYSYWLTIGAYTASILKKKQKIDYAVSRAHGYDCCLNRIYQPYRKFIDKRLDRIFFVSENNRDKYLKDIGCIFRPHKEKYEVYRLGLENINNCKQISDNKKIVIVSCSSVIPVKRIDIIINSLALINDIQVEWFHFGTGVDFEKISAYASKKLSNMQNIKYEMKGFIENAEINSFYKQKDIDLFINTSDSEGIPMSIMEAQQFGIISIGRDVGGISEIVLSEFLVTDNPQTIAKKIEYYSLLTVNQKNEFRKKAQEIIANDFNAEKNTQLFISRLPS